MADNENGAAGQAATAQDKATQQQQAAKMSVLAQYVRDLSFENILVQKGTKGEAQPDIQVQVNLDARRRQAENQYEVIVKLTVNSKTKEGGEPLFLLELEYAGLFHIENVPEDQLHPFLLIECPRILFPFLRRIVSDVTRDGGFPPLNLDNIDFVQIYRAEIARRQQAAQQQPEGKTADA